MQRIETPHQIFPCFPIQIIVNTPFSYRDSTTTTGPIFVFNVYIRVFLSLEPYSSQKSKMVVFSASEQRKVVLAAKEYLRLLDTHKYRSIREQATRRKVSHATLSRYVETIRKAKEDQPVLPSLTVTQAGKNRLLSHESELAIEAFVQKLERGLVPASVAMVEDAANTLLQRIDSNTKPVSKSWLQRFLKRFPSLLVKSTEPLETQRKNAHDPEAIHLWFSDYEGVLQQHNIQRFDVWNFDETGFRIGWLGKSKVVVSRANKKKRVRRKPT